MRITLAALVYKALMAVLIVWAIDIARRHREQRELAIAVAVALLLMTFAVVR